MNEAWLKTRRCSAWNDLFKVISTSILIYDVALRLLDEPPPDGVEMPAPPHIACMRNILSSLCMDEEVDEDALPRIRGRRITVLRDET